MSWEQNCLRALKLAFNENEILDNNKFENFDEARNLFKQSLDLNPNKAWPYLKYADMVAGSLDKLNIYVKSLIAEDNIYAKEHIKDILKRYFLDKEIFDNCIIVNNLIILVRDKYVFKQILENLDLNWIRNNFFKTSIKILLVGKEVQTRELPAELFYWSGDKTNFGFNKLNKIPKRKKIEIIKLGFIGSVNDNLSKIVNSIVKINSNKTKYSLEILTNYFKENQSLYNKLDNITVNFRNYDKQYLCKFYSTIDGCIYIDENLYSPTPLESIFLGIPVIISNAKFYSRIFDYSCLLKGRYGITEQCIIRGLEDFYSNYEEYKKLAELGSGQSFYSWDEGLKKVLMEIK